MRARKKPSVVVKPGTVLAIANHAAMGVALGLVFALILIWAPFFGVLALINLSDDPVMTMETFVGTVVMMFGVGAALTGFILMMEENQ
jgi:protein-S-isoprenylcysteine O-methyltransferase Ste14